MAKLVTVVLPVPPSLNNLYPTNRRTGKRFPSSQYQRWRRAAMARLLEQWRELRPALPVTGARTIRIRLPQNTRGDVDNRAKAPLDFLAKNGVTNDDRHNETVTIGRDPTVTECVIEIREAGE